MNGCLRRVPSKAFDVVDVVDHGILAAKLTGLNMSHAILYWIFSLLTGQCFLLWATSLAEHLLFWSPSLCFSLIVVVQFVIFCTAG